MAGGASLRRFFIRGCLRLPLSAIMRFGARNRPRAGKPPQRCESVTASNVGSAVTPSQGEARLPGARASVWCVANAGLAMLMAVSGCQGRHAYRTEVNKALTTAEERCQEQAASYQPRMATPITHQWPRLSRCRNGAAAWHGLQPRLPRIGSRRPQELCPTPNRRAPAWFSGSRPTSATPRAAWPG